MCAIPDVSIPFLPCDHVSPRKQIGLGVASEGRFEVPNRMDTLREGLEVSGRVVLPAGKM